MTQAPPHKPSQETRDPSSSVPTSPRAVPPDVSLFPEKLTEQPNDIAQRSSSDFPDDLRTPWDWVDLVVFALLAVGGTFLISIALIGALSLAGMGPAELRSSEVAKSYFAIANQTILSFALLAYLALQTKLRVGTPFWPTAGWRPLVSRRLPGPIAYLSLGAAGLLLSVFVQWVSSFSEPKGKLPIEGFFQDRGSALLLMLLSVLLAPVLEETVFRGLIYPVIARSFGMAASVVITGTLFGLLHSAQLWGGWLQIGLLVVVGIVFTYVRAVTRTVLASYLLHVSYNSYLFALFLAGSHWLRVLPGGR